MGALRVSGLVPVLVLPLLLAAPATPADGNRPATAADPDLAALLDLLDEQTDLATRTGMNADFIPGMATVLTGDDLRVRGARSVWEALALVPGFTQGLEASGERQVLSRGVGFGYASGQIKLLLDGVSMNNSLMATANPVLNLPIEQVARIEVIRGPGASVFGEFAYAGVVNVITRTGERGWHLQAAEAGRAGGGLLWHWQDRQRPISLSLNASGLAGDGGGVRIGEDALYPLGRAELSAAPGRVNDASRFASLFAELHWGKGFATVKWLDDAYGDHYGINHFLPPAAQGLASTQRNLIGELGRDFTLSPTLGGRLRLEALDYERGRNGLYVFPAGWLGPDLTRLDQHYRETRYLAAADLRWHAGPRHQVLFGLEAAAVRVRRADWDWTGLPFAVPPRWLDSGQSRRILSALVQDEFRPGERVTLTASLRLDDYSDLATYLSPRLAAVWRLDERHILKFQYARAFRPPTFYELAYPAAGAPKASEISTFELGAILKRPTSEARLILFHSDLTRPIAFDYDSRAGYLNQPDARLQGAELEWRQRLGERARIDANLSWVDAARSGSGEALPGGAALLANLALFARLTEPLTLVLQGRYVGERERLAGDPRAPVAGYAALDATLNWRRATTGPWLSVGVRNLTDTDLRFPELPTRVGADDLSYTDDYPQPGRRWWLSLGYAF